MSKSPVPKRAKLSAFLPKTAGTRKCAPKINTKAELKKIRTFFVDLVSGPESALKMKRRIVKLESLTDYSIEQVKYFLIFGRF